MPSLDGPFFDAIRQNRHQSRIDNGGGGCCHLVTDLLYQEFGFERLAVSVLMPDGSISIAGHYVSLLPDGSIMDPTADQFCVGHDVRILKPQDEDYGIYRPEFYAEWNPDTEEELKGWKDLPGRDYGWDDFSEEMRLRSERGDDWWATDPAARREWLRHISITYQEPGTDPSII